ncbi:DNA-3-methyladenine glycosylase family protein [Chloroflexota bacterium]
MQVNKNNKTNRISAVSRLKESDSLLAAVINQVGPCRLERGVQGFPALVRSITTQQLSNHAAKAIQAKLQALFGNDGLCPTRILQTSDEALRKTGLSMMKVGYLRDLADHVASSKVDFNSLEAIDDEAVIRILTQVRGIGRWTAEMYLIFSLGRPDVFPIDDLAIRTAMAHIYNLPETDFRASATKIAERWRPFRSIACWYLYQYRGILYEKNRSGAVKPPATA